MTNVSLYSTTPWREANFMNRTIINHFAKLGKSARQLAVTDATANVGGNTISFYLSEFGHINAVELDQTTYQMLISNVTTYGAGTHIKTYCADYTEIYKNLSQDIVFMDPPWGGPDYKNYQKLDLYLGQIEISEICESLLAERLAEMIVVKVPYNYNFGRFSRFNHIVEHIYRKKRHSYSIIIVTHNPVVVEGPTGR